MTTSMAFLRAVDPELTALAEQAEQTLWTSPRATLIQGRLFGEQAAISVAAHERLTFDYSMKQIDRVHMLHRRGCFDDDLRSSFEWLRMNGNAAAHDAREIHIDLSLTAHRHIHAISAWYAETYGPLDLEVPKYEMPVRVDRENMNPIATEDLGQKLEKVLQEQLSEKVLPSIDEKFREMQVLFKQLTGQMDEWANGKPESKMIGSESTQTEIADYLKDRSLDIVDKRGNGGALWIIGGWELKDQLFALKPSGFYFRYARNGSQSTKRKPAWFLTGKEPSEKRWITSLVANEEKSEEKAAIAAGSIMASTEQAATDAENLLNVESGQPSVIIPAYLHNRLMSTYKSARISEIAGHLEVYYVQDWTEERLKALYRSQPKLLHDVLVQLWFLGFEFRGDLGRFLKLKRGKDSNPLESIKAGILLEDILTLDIARQLERFGIQLSEQLNGLPETSLQWLLRDKYDEVMKVINDSLKLPEHVVFESKDTEESVEQHLSESTAFRLFLNNESIVIPPQYLNDFLKDIPFRGCSFLIENVIGKLQMNVIGQLPQDLMLLARKINGAGPGAVQKMFQQLSGYIDARNDTTEIGQTQTSAPTDDFTHRTAEQYGKLVWQETIVELKDEDARMELQAAEFPMVRRLLAELERQGMKTVGELPADLIQLRLMDGVGVVAIDKFLKQLQVRLDAYRVQSRHKQALREMSLDQRIAFMRHRLEVKWANRFTEENLATNRNLQILHMRWKERREGRKATLESLGQHYGLTRERVRQIIRKVLSQLHHEVIDLEKTLKEACETHHSFYYYPIDVIEKFDDGLIEQVLEAYEGLVYLEQYGWWTLYTQEQIDDTAEQLRRAANQKLRGQQITTEQMHQLISDEVQLPSFPKELGIAILLPILYAVQDGTYILANSRKSDLVEMVLRLYPSGVEVYKRAEELLEAANRIKPGELTRDRDFTSVCTRDEFATTGYLWGRGRYIHYSFVSLDVPFIREVSQYALSLLEKRSPISVGRLFQSFEERLTAAGIPNEYALYTMIRQVGSEELAPNKFPHIWHKDDAFQLTNAEVIKSFIREYQRPLTLETLREEFVVKRGWKRFTLEFSIQSDSDFVSSNFGLVALREFYPFTEHDFNQVMQQLEQLMEDVGVIHVNRLYDVCKERCVRMGIESGYLLYDLLKVFDIPNHRFARYPLISNDNYPIEELTLLTVVEQYIEEQEAEVPRELVYHWVTEELGAREETLDQALASSSNIFYYQSGQFGEYIHRKRLGWTSDDERQLVEDINRLIAQQEKLGYSFITIDRLEENYSLPALPNDLAWTSDLLVDCLRKSGKFRLLGSLSRIVVPIDNNRIVDETSWIAHILERDFNGQASIKEIQMRLREFKYSKDGRFLLETLTKVDSGTAGFEVVEDLVRRIDTINL
ncbi:sigma factor-like helix-turn-helix DNA-binding protein [Paenibacillus chungangensis]|uniref:Sigma factor-like helix-turn-helix DNA-binding protein n=1 Tax=Paenibacillus chungangensis TaxID=696535 RepID=A0ABW3HSP4_9BACL